MSVRRTVALAALAACLAATAQAETVKPFQINAQIVSGCVVATDASGRWGNINLGTVPGVAGTSAESTLMSTAGAGLVIECTPGVSASLSADGGSHSSAGERNLRAAGRADLIRYRLFADGGTAPWAGAALPLAFAGGVRTVPVRAVATLSGPMAAGIYTDTVRVTLSW